MPDATPAAPAAPSKPVDSSVKPNAADAKPAMPVNPGSPKPANVKQTKAEVKTPAASTTVTPAAPTAPVKQWFGCSMQGIPGKACILADGTDEAIELFKVGYGITSTPYQINVQGLGADYVPTAANLDMNDAIQSLLANG